jgi:para-nitrobenzyl esterase
MNPMHLSPSYPLGKSLLESLSLCGLLVFAVVGTLRGGPDDGSPVVATADGAVRGRLLADGRGAVYKGIPFAQPPVGRLRWREPMPVARWTGVLDAGHSGPPAAQPAQGWNDAAAAASSEDCLYLDVWTPQASPGRLPVMVWVHGGANVAGAGGFDPLYDGRALISHGVILVVVEYRLGVFGFFSHPELTRESPHHASGNYGILDQVAALQWVHANIAHFGGDPGNVTIFGQSAGATDIAALMASPLSRGLFHRAIAESGALQGRNQTLAQAERSGEGLAGRIGGTAPRDLASLRSVPMKDLLGAGQGFSGFATDGWVFPMAPFEVWRTGREHAVPLIIGSNAIEFPFGGPAGALEASIREFFGDTSSRALALYGVSEPLPADPLYGDSADQWGSDLFRCPSVILGGWHSRAGSPAWEYELARAIPPHPRVAHSDDLPYVFGNLLPTGSKPGEYTDADRRLSAAIQAYWTNFAKTGNPNGPSVPAWPGYDAAGKSYMAFTTDAGLVPRSNERGPFCDLFREVLSVPPPSR